MGARSGLRELAHRDFWLKPASQADPEPIRLTFYWPERADQDGEFGPIWYGLLGFTSLHLQWSKRMTHSDSLSALLFQPYIAHSYMCGCQNVGSAWFWWREPGDLDTLAFWAPSPAGIEAVQGRPDDPAAERDGWWIFPPDGGPPSPMQVQFGAPAQGPDGDYEARFWVGCRFFEWAAKARGADGVQALMSMRAAAEAFVAPWLAKGYRLNMSDEPDFYGMEYCHLFGPAPT